MRIGRALAAAALALSALATWAEGSLWPGGGGPYFGVDFTLGTPSSSSDVFRAAFPGASLRYVASRNLEFSLDYAFMDIEYYYPEGGAAGWTGPVQWASMPDRFGGQRGSWIFYQTRHFLAPQAWYVAPVDIMGVPLAARVGAGPAISFVVPNESAKYYPGLSDAYTQFKQSFKAFLGFSLRAGIEYRPWGWARVGIEYLFVVDSIFDMAGDMARLGADYLDKSGNVVVFAGLRI